MWFEVESDSSGHSLNRMDLHDQIWDVMGTFGENKLYDEMLVKGTALQLIKRKDHTLHWKICQTFNNIVSNRKFWKIEGVVTIISPEEFIA